MLLIARQLLPTLNMPTKSSDIIENMARIEGRYWGYAPLTLGILAVIGCIAGGLGMLLGRAEIFMYAFPPALVFLIVAAFWDRSRYSLMVLNVISKQKHAKTRTDVDSEG